MASEFVDLSSKDPVFFFKDRETIFLMAKKYLPCREEGESLGFERRR